MANIRALRGGADMSQGGQPTTQCEQPLTNSGSSWSQERIQAPSFQVIDPVGANDLFAAGKAVLVDVRTAEELKQGFVPGSLHVAWQQGAAMTKNPRFLKELSQKVAPDKVVLFICRSGKRSADAALTAAKAGYIHAFNVLEGAEGDIEAGTSGWRKRGLPWTRG